MTLRDLLAEQPEGMDREALLGLARERFNPDLTEGQLDSEIEFLDEEIETVDGVIRLRRGAPQPAPSPRPERLSRAGLARGGRP
jgi:hypothetical protein